MSMTTKEWVVCAYKKLKGNVYFDKTQLPLVDRLVEFEYNNNLEPQLKKLENLLDSGDSKKWEVFTKNILDKISVFVYPKKLKHYTDSQIIFNDDCDPISAEKAQFFIDMPVMGHLLGVLWVLTIGQYLDNRACTNEPRMYVHSYGNRLRKNLYDDKDCTITNSPNLFEAYFSQYESWRDQALSCAQKRLDEQKDALIITLDLKSFYYSVDIDEDSFSQIYENAKNDPECEPTLPKWAKLVHDFVYAVFSQYSEKLRNLNDSDELCLGNRVFLPIGFLPSNIMSNWILTPFDEAISKRINPVYYGRYVDDMILVDKIERNSPLRKKTQNSSLSDDKLTVQDVVLHYFCSCHSEEYLSDTCMLKQLFVPLKVNELTPQQRKKYEQNCHHNANKDKSKNPYTVYRINPDIINHGLQAKNACPDIQIQNDKVKVFYFRAGSTRALLDCFRTQIGQNASEFRFLPDMDDALGNNNYCNIFKLQNDESLHKLRGVSNVSVDKFSLSKFLGKYRKASRMITDKKENNFEQDLLTIMDSQTLIENYTLWERLLEIMIVNDRLDLYGSLSRKIIDSICQYDVLDDLLKDNAKEHHRESLVKTLHAAICRTSALCWGTLMNQTLQEITQYAKEHFSADLEYINATAEKRLCFFDINTIKVRRKQYCQSWMVNKYVLPLPIVWISESIFENKEDINLCHLEQFRNHSDFKMMKAQSHFLPFMATPQDISFALACQSISRGEQLLSPSEQQKRIEQLYCQLNYQITDQSKSVLKEIHAKPLGQSQDGDSNKCYVIAVDSPSASKIKVAVGNARLSEKDFTSVLLGTPNRSFERYQQLDKLLKSALTEHADLLVLPENFLPFEWLPDIARLCANNQMALVTGIEHILSQKEKNQDQKVYNLTAIILPYESDSYRYSHIVFHHKVHYSPEEKRLIEGYRFVPIEGKSYQLFQWRDLWFSVYCCFEIASIHDRALFKNLSDLTIAVEWNRDIPYFSNILESLCRDLHCYCIQVNSSDYGDSRVIIPAKTDKRDLIKTKGGINYTVLTDEIDVEGLRSFQRKEYELQKDDDRFKTTPPDFDPAIPEKKQQGRLRQYLIGNS